MSRKNCDFCKIINALNEAITNLIDLPQVGDHYDDQVTEAVNALDTALTGHTYMADVIRCRACDYALDKGD